METGTNRGIDRKNKGDVVTGVLARPARVVLAILHAQEIRIPPQAAALSK